MNNMYDCDNSGQNPRTDIREDAVQRLWSFVFSFRFFQTIFKNCEYLNIAQHMKYVDFLWCNVSYVATRKTRLCNPRNVI